MSRKFLVVDSSGIVFNLDFTGMLLIWIRELPELGQHLFVQPATDANGKLACPDGTIAFDYKSVVELEENANVWTVVETGVNTNR